MYYPNLGVDPEFDTKLATLLLTLDSSFHKGLRDKIAPNPRMDQDSIDNWIEYYARKTRPDKGEALLTAHVLQKSAAMPVIPIADLPNQSDFYVPK